MSCHDYYNAGGHDYFLLSSLVLDWVLGARKNNHMVTIKKNHNTVFTRY